MPVAVLCHHCTPLQFSDRLKAVEAETNRAAVPPVGPDPATVQELQGLRMALEQENMMRMQLQNESRTQWQQARDMMMQMKVRARCSSW